jgi:hypothetical protein
MQFDIRAVVDSRLADHRQPVVGVLTTVLVSPVRIRFTYPPASIDASVLLRVWR